MWQLAHLASGALVGQQIQNPEIAFVAGVATHLLIDKIPHYWPKPAWQKKWFTVIDYLITIPAFYFGLKYFHTNQMGLIWGAMGSLAVDIVLVGIPYFHNSPIGSWHYRRQPHHIEARYLSTDFIVILISALLLKP